MIPNAADIETYRKYVETLPAIDKPEIFGLHQNADLTCRTLQVRLVAGMFDTKLLTRDTKFAVQLTGPRSCVTNLRNTSKTHLIVFHK